jgi:hypothetical protein
LKLFTIEFCGVFGRYGANCVLDLLLTAGL